MSVSYIGIFQYQICPNIPNLRSNIPYIDYEVDLSRIEPFLLYNCKYINELNIDNINRGFSDLEFCYKLYVQNRWNYYVRYYYPVFKLKVDHFVRQVYLSYLKHLQPGIARILSVIKNHVLIYWTLAKNLWTNLQIQLLKSRFYQVYLQQYVIIVCHQISQGIDTLKANSGVKSFQQKTNFLAQEFKNVVNIKLKTSSKSKPDDNLVHLAKEIINQVDSGNEEETDDENLPPITVKLTSTIYEYMSVETLSPAENKINALLNTFDGKIRKTLDLALINISNDINPIINSTIDTTQPELTEVFKYIQNQNYNYYKDAHEMISRIDKDLSNLKEFGYDQYIETVSRQDMRDEIEKVKFFNSNQFLRLEGIINDKFAYLIDAYLLIIQDTIDILESFADSTFQVFANDLSVAINESNNEDFNWNSWKRFHDLKTLLWDKRDFIFNQAGLLKERKWGELEIDSDFKNWLKFINEVNIHMSFLSQENQEYLQLIRAKANVSFQSREAEIRRLEEIKTRERDLEAQEVAQEVTQEVTQEEPVKEAEDGPENVNEVLESKEQNLNNTENPIDDAKEIDEIDDPEEIEDPEIDDIEVDKETEADTDPDADPDTDEP